MIWFILWLRVCFVEFASVDEVDFVVVVVVVVGIGIVTMCRVVVDCGVGWVVLCWP